MTNVSKSTAQQCWTFIDYLKVSLNRRADKVKLKTALAKSGGGIKKEQ